MIFSASDLDGIWVIDPERQADLRGYFARTFCVAEFATHGLPSAFVQCNVSQNERRRTLRGLHWQDEPHPEGKLVRCARGVVYDVVADLRPGSPTRYQWRGYELSAANGRSLFIPGGFAHGFQTLTDDVEVFYQMTETYQPELARGARWNDVALAITWPLPDPILSERDRLHPDLHAAVG